MSAHLIPVRIAASDAIARGVRRYVLRPLDGDPPLPLFEAGAHVDLHLTNGVIRQYSLLNGPNTVDRYEIAVLRDAAGRGGSAFVHDNLAVGDVVEIGAPRCHFRLDESARYSVLIAGGIGVTPIWCMAQRLSAIGRAWEVHYAARTRDHAALLYEIEDGARAAGGLIATYFNEDGDPLMDLPAIVASAPEGTHFYCCGPLGLLDAFRTACAVRPVENIHFEQFTAAEPAARDGGYSVELARSGQQIDVAPGQSILDALAAAGRHVAYSCREGVCGSCETTVLAGTPDHRDALLTDEERAAGRTMMICCSGSLSARLVLDL
ncbi:PDR/VanB family oxidoreductase [Sphingomonas nostoxanthinifaciens]|uniref:PDR/VanB family oxidoreductase n=1 Tax=Sphingomonas nostoxanthinifaciens TaxID=2872652 RepID=UPI001CC1CC02|nr:PDR/VanB family oxidoreductase [Sphingomonas nostoxanthinifaciens]UAK25645.1 PDR/VanB family oxidoreductase [Sphingomonas nostoxanthinifaciens]